MGTVLTTFKRRGLLIVLFALTMMLSGGIWMQAQSAPAKPQVTVYRSASCTCCLKWVDHLNANGFDAKAIEVDDIAQVKRTYGVPSSVESCHTALVNGYVVEGHVPADAIARLVREKPAIAGLAVPGMPAGSPGMETASGRKDAYAIMSFDKAGGTAVYDQR
jgi:hypothetical protein